MLCYVVTKTGRSTGKSTDFIDYNPDSKRFRKLSEMTRRYCGAFLGVSLKIFTCGT